MIVQNDNRLHIIYNAAIHEFTLIKNDNEIIPFNQHIECNIAHYCASEGYKKENITFEEFNGNGLTPVGFLMTFDDYVDMLNNENEWEWDEIGVLIENPEGELIGIFRRQH